jgi:hypothetical protein
MVMLDKTGTRSLDGYTPRDLAEQLGRPVYFAGYLSEVERIVSRQLLAHGSRNTTRRVAG